MSIKSLLLALDGSQESLYAAETAWRIAKRTNAAIVAQTVIDSQAVWEFFGKDLPGIIGSGPYLTAHAAIETALKEVAETLLMSYEARAQDCGIKNQCVMDEGNTVREIVRRASEHDLLIMGHRDNSAHRADKERRHFDRYSHSEQIAYYCLRPVLIVQHPCERWQSARLVVSPNSYSKENLKFFLDLTGSLSVKREVACIGPEAGFAQVVADIEDAVAELPQVSVIKWAASDMSESWHFAADVNDETLLAISTTDKAKQRTVGNDIAVETFIHYLHVPALLLLPALAGIEGG